MSDQASSAGGDGEECPWCKFMKGGPCRAVFETWQACVDSVMDSPAGAADEQNRRVAVDKCAAVTAPLFECLVKHPEYYGPQLDTMADRSRAESETPSTAATPAATSPAAATVAESSVRHSSREPGSKGSSSIQKSSSATAAEAGSVSGVSGASSSGGTSSLNAAVA